MYVPSASAGPTIVIVADADFVLSDTDVATTFTVLPGGIAAGAVYVVATLVAVVVGLNVPHAAVPQVTV